MLKRRGRGSGVEQWRGGGCYFIYVEFDNQEEYLLSILGAKHSVLHNH